VSTFFWKPRGQARRRNQEVQQGTLALMVLTTLEVLGPQHGYGLAKRIEQISNDALTVNQGSLYPLLLKLETGGRDHLGMGVVGQQSTGALLPLDGGRPAPTPSGNAELGGNHRADCTVPQYESGGRVVMALQRFLTRLFASLTGRRNEARLREELESHLQMQAADNVRAGMSMEEARRQAVLKFGPIEALKDNYRDEQRLPVLDDLLSRR
jgi:hypothetical protein